MFHSELLYHKERTLSSIFKAGRRDHAHSRGVVKSIGPGKEGASSASDAKQPAVRKGSVAQSSPVPTGDGSDPAVWCMLLAASAASLACLIAGRCKA